jgi:hypothetical protein
MCSTPSQAPADGALEQGVHVAVAVGEHAQQHGQVDPGDELDAPRLDQLGGDVAGVAP